jgi:hypothetical protein
MPGKPCSLHIFFNLKDKTEPRLLKHYIALFPFYICIVISMILDDALDDRLRINIKFDASIGGHVPSYCN